MIRFKPETALIIASTTHPTPAEREPQEHWRRISGFSSLREFQHWTAFASCVSRRIQAASIFGCSSYHSTFYRSFVFISEQALLLARNSFPRSTPHVEDGNVEMVDAQEPSIFISLPLIGDAPPLSRQKTKCPRLQHGMARPRYQPLQPFLTLSVISRLVSSQRLSAPNDKSHKKRPVVD